jgi:hypothetical protein
MSQAQNLPILIARYFSVIIGSLAAGLSAFVVSFFFMDFFWTHVVVTDKTQLTPGDGVMVIGGGFLLGVGSGLALMGLILYRFWPRKTTKRLSL